MTCIPCNAPCNKCIQHPSTCSTCLTGNLFRNTCPDNCPVGYYAENNVCKTCSYDCAACLGLSTTCISCPETKRILFDGKCYQTCPVPLVNGKCPNVCPSGYFTQAVNGNCLKCNSRCRTCENDADRCTSCQIGVSSNGACVTACPANTLNVNGNCLPCAEGCNGCQSTVTQCSACR
jgi:proprotein convertase subtilisin/kexin type 5